MICHHWTLKIVISWRFTEHFAAVFSACRVSTQLPGVCLESSPGIALYVGHGKIHAINIFKWLPPSANSQIRGDLDH